MYVTLHQPFAIPKHWVTGPANGFRLTEDSAEAGDYTDGEVAVIRRRLNREYPNAVVNED